jgi:hypothetical protein
MMYNIEFIHHVEGQTEALALDVISLVGDGISAVIEQAEGLYRKLDTVPRPEGFRIRESGGEIVHEFHEFPEIENA